MPGAPHPGFRIIAAPAVVVRRERRRFRSPSVAASRFPCWVCGLPTEGVDAYVVCSDCLLTYERRSRERAGDGVDHLPLIAGEAEARLRKLLDDW